MCRLKKTKQVFMGLIFIFVLCSALLMPANVNANVGKAQTLQTTTNVAGIGQAANSKNVPNAALSTEQLQEIMTQVLATEQQMMFPQWQNIPQQAPNSTVTLFLVVPVR